MKIIGLLSILLIALTPLKAEELQRDLDSYDKIIVTGNVHVEVYKDDKNEIWIDSGEIVLENIITEVKKNVLEIKVKTGFYKDKKVNLFINTTKGIDIDAKNGAQVIVTYEVTEETVSYKAFAGGKIIVNKMNAGSVVAEINSGGEIHLVGKAKKLETGIKTGGDIFASRLYVTDAVCRVLAGGRTYVKVSNKLDAKVTSGGTITYVGQPKELIEKTSLGGTIKKKK